MTRGSEYSGFSTTSLREKLGGSCVHSVMGRSLI